MDAASLLTLLLLASSLAVQPWSVLAAVLLVASKGGLAKAIAFVAGWVLALTAVSICTIALYPKTPQAASGSPWTSWVQIVSGVALGGWLLVRSRRPAVAKSNRQPQDAQPKWMAQLDSMPPLPAFVLGAFLPNYAIVVAAVGNVVAAGLSQTQAAVVLFAFIVVGSAGVAAPLLVLVFRRQDAPGIYQAWRAWLVTNGHKLLTVVLAVVALILIVKGGVGLIT
jgi:hypothetical protein